MLGKLHESIFAMVGEKQYDPKSEVWTTPGESLDLKGFAGLSLFLQKKMGEKKRKTR
jgi:hypothetical protein